MNWALFALVVTGIMTAAWLFVLVKSPQSFMSIYVSLGFLVLAGMNSAAPVRGFVDPNYVGYGFGLLRADKGLVVTLVAGSVFLVSAVCAFIAARNRAGRGDVAGGGNLRCLYDNSGLALAGGRADRSVIECDSIRRVSDDSGFGGECVTRSVAGATLLTRRALGFSTSACYSTRPLTDNGFPIAKSGDFRAGTTGPGALEPLCDPRGPHRAGDCGDVAVSLFPVSHAAVSLR